MRVECCLAFVCVGRVCSVCVVRRLMFVACFACVVVYCVCVFFSVVCVVCCVLVICCCFFVACWLFVPFVVCRVLLDGMYWLLFVLILMLFVCVFC